ncbi:sensory histidine kinase UhpB [Mycobacteroides abscessus subsp. abscessus]|nr:sensory histidine kinase UhpB [Mycobacteroides abscessus subsp. abscessus]
MDEMDIRSKWDFPNEWVFEPNSLQCLTLMRVLEESLTNVIKHSQAEHVSVSMQFVPPKQLVLKVQDDGIGAIGDFLQRRDRCFCDTKRFTICPK